MRQCTTALLRANEKIEKQCHGLGERQEVDVERRIPGHLSVDCHVMGILSEEMTSTRKISIDSGDQVLNEEFDQLASKNENSPGCYPGAVGKRKSESIRKVMFEFFTLQLGI